MGRHPLTALLLVVLLLLTACGAPGAGPTPTPPQPSEAATVMARASGQAPQGMGGPGGSDIVPTLDVPTPSAAQREVTAAAQAVATFTPISAADSATATALAGGSAGPSATPTAFTEAESTTATALVTGGGAPATRTPVAGGRAVLPAPVYLLSPSAGQVLRIERDVMNYRQLTFERRPIHELAVPAQGGGFFYIVGDEEGERALVNLSGAGRRDLLSGKLSELAVTPDGRQAFFRLEDPEPGLLVGQDESPSGIWTTWIEGGRPSLVIADVPADGAFDPATPAWAYAPVAVSPDGRALAVFAYDQDGPGIPGGELVIIDLTGQREPVRGPSCCESPVWHRDGHALYTAGGGPAPDTRYGLYRTHAATGAETPVLTGDGAAEVPLATAPFVGADGQLYAFVDLVPAQELSWQYPFQPALSRISPDGTVTPLAPTIPTPVEVLWAPSASGALVSVFVEDPERSTPLFWQPADGSPALTLAFDGADMGWVPANGPLEGGDCALFTPLSYQQGGARREDPAVADLQARLLALGFDGGQPDGLYGEQTRAGVQAFQQARGLPATGDVDCATWQALLAQP